MRSGNVLRFLCILPTLSVWSGTLSVFTGCIRKIPCLRAVVSSRPSPSRGAHRLSSPVMWYSLLVWRCSSVGFTRVCACMGGRCCDRCRHHYCLNAIVDPLLLHLRTTSLNFSEYLVRNLILCEVKMLAEEPKTISDSRCLILHNREIRLTQSTIVS